MSDLLQRLIPLWVTCCLAICSPVANQASERVEIPSPSLEKQATVESWVTRAEGAAEAPVAAIVFLHGWGDDGSAWQRLGGESALSRAAAGARNRLVAVAPGSGGSGWTNWRDGSALWEDFLAVDLISWLRREMGATTISVVGTSMGGEAAIRLLFRYPERFACDPDKLPEWAARGFREMPELQAQWGKPLDRQLWRSRNVLTLASEASLPGAANEPRLYFDVGVSDSLGFAATNAQLSALLARRSIPHVFALREGGHGDEFTAAHLPASLTAVARCADSM